MIDQDGEQAGIVSIQQALDMAEQAALDLVEISPNAEPPVCRIMNYGKFLYEKSKTAKEQKKKRTKGSISCPIYLLHTPQPAPASMGFLRG